MAILTWQNVTAPDFSSSQSGIRTAGDFFNRAVQNGEDIITGLRAAETAKKAEAQANADRLLTQQYLTAQDPKAISEMLARGIDKKADGSQLVDPSQVNAEMLRRYAAQQQQLQANALEQEKRDQTQADRQASFLVGNALKSSTGTAVTDLPRALQMLGTELNGQNVSADKIEAAITALERVRQNETTRMNAETQRNALNRQANKDQRDRAEKRNILQLAQQARSLGIDNPAQIQEFIKKIKDPIVQAGVVDELNLDYQPRRAGFSRDQNSLGATYGAEAMAGGRTSEVGDELRDYERALNSARKTREVNQQKAEQELLSKPYGSILKANQDKEAGVAEAITKEYGAPKRGDGLNRVAMAEKVQKILDASKDPQTNQYQITPRAAVKLLAEASYPESKMNWRSSPSGLPGLEVSESALEDKVKEFLKVQRETAPLVPAVDPKEADREARLQTLLDASKKQEERVLKAQRTYETNPNHAPQYQAETEKLRDLVLGIRKLMGTADTAPSIDQSFSLAQMPYPYPPPQAPVEEPAKKSPKKKNSATAGK